MARTRRPVVLGNPGSPQVGSGAGIERRSCGPWPSGVIAVAAALALGSFGAGCSQSHEIGGPGGADAGRAGRDAGPGMRVRDASTPGFDAAGYHYPDAGPIRHDAGWIGPDAGWILHDAGWIGPDAGWILYDAGWIGPDAGWIGPDAGIDYDAGPPPHPDIWDGYVESYMFPSGSDHVHIMLDIAMGDGPRTGFVVFGMGAPPPPATNPNVGYPPGAFMGFIDTNQVWEGFAYPILVGSVSGQRVRVTVSTGSLYERWCELQPSYPQDPSGMSYGCLPNTGGGGSSSGGCFYNDPSTGAPVPIDCVKFFLCSMGSVCSCNAGGCTADLSHTIPFDFHTSSSSDHVGETAMGSVRLQDGLHNMYLTLSY